MSTTIIVGGHFGDEGKGKIVSYLCAEKKPKVVARGGVGPNAGHSVVIKGKKYGIRMIPSGFVSMESRVLIGAGVLVNPNVFMDELELLKDFNMKGRVAVDNNCAIITKQHIIADTRSKHLTQKIKSTGTGCGPANADRVNRVVGLAKDVPELKPYLTDVPLEINEAIDAGENVIIEGTQGFGLSLFYGTYPYVTSNDTSASAIASDVGVGPTKIDEVVTVFKAHMSRVGGGPFPTEIPMEEAEKMGLMEFGTVTGRRRKIGKFDFELGRRSVMINGATQIAINCLDLMFPESKDCKTYEELPREARAHVEKIEKELKVPATLLGIGPEVHDIIDRRK